MGDGGEAVGVMVDEPLGEGEVAGTGEEAAVGRLLEAEAEENEGVGVCEVALGEGDHFGLEQLI